jgi:hypothetical protein
MQRITVILLLCGIFGQVSFRTAWTLHYQWNRAVYVAKCVNKDKPSLHCDGKCAFKKQMAAREKNSNKEPQLPDNFHNIKDIQLFFEAPTTPFIVELERLNLATPPPYQAVPPEAPVADIFHPPA